MNTDTLHHFREAMHMFQRRISVAKNGFKQYQGTPEQIANQIITDCWNGTFFQVSSGHFSLFYMRDFSMCIEALQKLGYKKEIEKTLQFALTCYSRENRISTTINKNGTCFDVFSYAPDSLAFLLLSLRISKNQELVEIYKPFLEQQIRFFETTVFDKETGLIRKDKNFSSIKDNAKRQSSCYDNCCAAVIAREATTLHLQTTLDFKEIKNNIKKIFWTGTYFRDSAETTYIAGDANTFPFWFGVFSEKEEREMLKKVIATIQKEKLDSPFPLKYTSFVPKNFFFPLTLVAPNYEGNTIWPHLGLCYINVVAKIDKKMAKKYLQKYKQEIQKHHTFLELYDAQGNPYKTLFYVTDEAMLWSSMWLKLKDL